MREQPELDAILRNFGLFTWLYENESANSSRRNKQAKKVKAQRGLFVGSNPPYGYNCQNGVLKIRKDNSPDIVRRIFQEYLDGTGMDTIAKTLTTAGVPTPSQVANKTNASNLWHASSIKNILNNPHYCLNKVAVREKELMHLIMEDLKSLFNSLKEETFLNSLLNKLNAKKRNLLKELEKVQSEIETLRNKKLEYVDLYTENVISKEDLVEYRELTDNKIKELQIKKTELNEKLQECDNEDFAINIGKTLKEVLNLKDLTPQVLHSLVEKITCKNDGTVHIQYSFVNPLQET